MNKKVCILGGGTVDYIAEHLALSAPAYGATARKIAELAKDKFDKCDIDLILTNMALGKNGSINTVQDLSDKIKTLVADPSTKVIFMSCAVVDYRPAEVTGVSSFGKYSGRLSTSENPTVDLKLEVNDKIISQIRKHRKDIFLVGFKTTVGASPRGMYLQGLNLCKKSSCNLVLVNDTKTRFNMIITPEEAAYCQTFDRNKVLQELVDMVYNRSHLTFTRSTVINGTPVSWSDHKVPDSLRKVVDFCISNKAYKPFNGATVGHFACKVSDTEFLTSIRKSNFNDLNKVGLVYVKTDGPDSVLAYGAKPSVGGQSQRIIFKEHDGYDCVVHFHSPLLISPRNHIPIVSQKEVECGSHQCGQNTSNGLRQFGNLKAVMLDNHGPNIIFNRNINPEEVIDFIYSNFDLSSKTGGYNL